MELMIGLMFFSYLSVSHAVQGKNQETLQQKRDNHYFLQYANKLVKYLLRFPRKKENCISHNPKEVCLLLPS